jgi:hypothetical protein
MTITNPMEGLRARSRPSTSGPHMALAGTLAAILAAAAVLDQSLPKGQLLPAVCTMFFVAAAAVAAIAWLRPMSRQPMSYWDIAGGLTFIGVCMAALIEPDQLIRFIAGTPTEH